jgi:hypothetical protein
MALYTIYETHTYDSGQIVVSSTGTLLKQVLETVTYRIDNYDTRADAETEASALATIANNTPATGDYSKTTAAAERMNDAGKWRVRVTVEIVKKLAPL